MKIKTALFGLVIGALVTALVMEKVENQRLRTALADFKREGRQVDLANGEARVTPDAAELARLDAEHAEFMRLRAQAAAFREATRDLTNAQGQIAELKANLQMARTSGESRHTKLAEGMKGVADFRNLGHGSATESFETTLWANGSRDTNVLAQSITFDEESRARVEQLFANAPEPLRDRFATVEELVAYMMSKTTPIVGMRVFEEQPISPGKMRLQAEWQFSDGRVQPNSFTFQQANNGAWQMVMEAGIVSKLGRMMEEEAAAMRAKTPM